MTDDHGHPHPADRSTGGIQVISRAAHMLRAIRESPGGLTPSELAIKLALPRTTIHRILSSLEEEGLIAPGSGPRGRYRLGPEITRLATAGTRDVVLLVHPLLVDLSHELTETVDLSILVGSQVTFVDQVDAPHRLRAASAVGDSFPLHSCAPGKAILAAMSSHRLEDLLPARMQAMTAKTVTDPETLLAQIEETRRTGVAYDYEEQNEGICAAGIAVSITGHELAVSVPIPAQRFIGREDEIAAALIAFKQTVKNQEWA